MIKTLAGILLITAVCTSAFGQTVEPKKWSSARPDIPGTFTVELGVNRGMSAPDKFSLGLWGSRTVNIYYQYDIRILKSRFSLVPGIGLSLERYKFKNNATPGYIGASNDSISLLTPTQIGIARVRKSQLITNYIDIPVELRYSSNPDDPARSFKIAFGGRVGYLYDGFSKVKYNDDGEVKKLKNKQDFNLTQIRYGLYGKVGIGSFSIFTYYNMTPLFKEGKGLYEGSPATANDFNTITVGISLASF